MTASIKKGFCVEHCQKKNKKKRKKTKKKRKKINKVSFNCGYNGTIFEFQRKSRLNAGYDGL